MESNAISLTFPDSDPSSEMNSPTVSSSDAMKTISSKPTIWPDTGFPKVSSNPMGPVPRKAKKTLPSAVVVSEPDGAKSTASLLKEARRKLKVALKRQKNMEEDLLFREFIELAEQEKKTIEQEKMGMVPVALRGGGEDDESWMGSLSPSSPVARSRLRKDQESSVNATSAGQKGQKRSHPETDDEASSHSSGSVLLKISPFTKKTVAPNPSLGQSTQSTSSSHHTTLLADDGGDDGGGKQSSGEGGRDSDSGGDSGMAPLRTQPLLQVDLDDPLYEIGTLGIAGRQFPSPFFTHTTQDVEFATNLKAGNHCFLARSNFKFTYAKLHAIEVDEMGRRTFRFQYDIKSKYTKDIPEALLVDHIRRANQFLPENIGSFILTNNSTNAGYSNDIFKLEIGPQRSVKSASKSGKSKGKAKTVRYCQVVGCNYVRTTRQGPSDEVDLCEGHGSMYKRSGSKIDKDDIADIDVIGNTMNINARGNNEYRAICAQYVDKWYDDDSTNDRSTTVKLSLVKIICEEFSNLFPSGRFLTIVGKGTSQETILVMTDNEIYNKIYAHMFKLRNALKSEYIFVIVSSRSVQSTLIVISFLVPHKDRIIPATEFLPYAAICVQVDITADILDDDDSINLFLLEHHDIDCLTVVNDLSADDRHTFNDNGRYEYETQASSHGSGHEFVYNQIHVAELNSNNTDIRNLPSYVCFTQFRRKNVIYRSFYSFNGKLSYFTIWAFPYNGSHLLRIDPVEKTIREIPVGQGDGIILKRGYPRIDSSIGAELDILIHRCVLMLYGGPNNSGQAFFPSLVGDHKFGDKLDYKAMNVQLLTLAQNVSKEANYNRALYSKK